MLGIIMEQVAAGCLRLFCHHIITMRHPDWTERIAGMIIWPVSKMLSGISEVTYQTENISSMNPILTGDKLSRGGTSTLWSFFGPTLDYSTSALFPRLINLTN